MLALREGDGSEGLESLFRTFLRRNFGFYHHQDESQTRNGGVCHQTHHRSEAQWKFGKIRPARSAMNFNRHSVLLLSLVRNFFNPWG
jgi:hypothetical protein